MKSMQPFFLLVQRPMVLFAAIGWMIAATFLIGQLVKQGGDPDMFMDASFLTVVLLSVFSGWVVGSSVLELQQSSFACVLPALQARLLPGFLLFAAGVVLAAVSLTIAASPSPPDGYLLFAFGMGAYATGASIRDPLSGGLTGLGIGLFLVLIATSGTQAQLAAEQPLLLFLLSAGLVTLGIYRLFGRNAVRSRSVERGRPVLSFSVAKLSRAQRKRDLVYGPKKSRWRRGYLGARTENWFRAAWYETYGGHRSRVLLRSITASWGLVLILLMEAWKTSAQFGLWKSLCWVLHDGLMRAPHPPLAGEHAGSFIMIAALIVVGGATVALWRPVSLFGNLLYPLSRRQKATVLFAGNFMDMAIMLLVIAPVMFVLGHISGLLAGVQPRFDYMPFFLRAMFITLILMPFAYWGGLQLRSAAWRNDPYSMVGISFGMAVFAVVAMVPIVIAGYVFQSPATELVILLALLGFSRLLYHNVLNRHYRSADLC